MWYYEVAPTKIVRSKSGVFTYSSETKLLPGQVVHVEAGTKTLIGVVIGEVAEPTFATKPIIDVVTQTPIPEPLLRLSEWLSEYYRTPLATVLQTVLPRGIDKKRRTRKHVDAATSVRERTTIVLNPDQKRAVTTVIDAGQATTILQGVTGSGKTEVYKEIARQTIAAGKSVIVLVPEISLTSQLIAEFSHDFDNLLITHSHMTEAERHHAWNDALIATEPHVIIGPRSALFLPIAKLGAILVDEAHEPSYKQEQAPRYSAIRAASVLGKLSDAPVVLGSATPLVADRYVAESGGHSIIRLENSARSGAVAAKVTLIDMKKREYFKRHRFLSNTLLDHLEKNIAEGTQSLVFHNRRGSAATTLCESCGWTAQCPRCYVPLTLHADHFRVSCHICGHNERVPTHCPTCQSADIIHKGIGTKLIESELRRLFPKARIARFDADSKAGETVDQLYDALYKGEIDIAIGTQIVAKGLDLPKLRTVGVIQADGGLSLPDFAASERTFQLLAQVVGRVGRNEHASTVIIQTYQPTHPVVTFGVAQNYDAFYDYTLEQRALGHFPPYTYLLKLTDVYKSERAAVRAAQELGRTLRRELHEDVRLLGPTPAFYERQHDTYRWQLTLKSPKREHLIDALEHLPPTHWQFELDPHSLL
jgi:primosomal protein N' (replication factor Y) (superfamily II helicase)